MHGSESYQIRVEDKSLLEEYLSLLCDWFSEALKLLWQMHWSWECAILSIQFDMWIPALLVVAEAAHVVNCDTRAG